MILAGKLFLYDMFLYIIYLTGVSIRRFVQGLPRRLCLCQSNDGFWFGSEKSFRCASRDDLCLGRCHHFVRYWQREGSPW